MDIHDQWTGELMDISRLVGGCFGHRSEAPPVIVVPFFRLEVLKITEAYHASNQPPTMWGVTHVWHNKEPHKAVTSYT